MTRFEKEANAVIHPALITLIWDIPNIDAFLAKNFDFLNNLEKQFNALDEKWQALLLSITELEQATLFENNLALSRVVSIVELKAEIKTETEQQSNDLSILIDGIKTQLNDIFIFADEGRVTHTHHSSKPSAALQSHPTRTKLLHAPQSKFGATNLSPRSELASARPSISDVSPRWDSPVSRLIIERLNLAIAAKATASILALSKFLSDSHANSGETFIDVNVGSLENVSSISPSPSEIPKLIDYALTHIATAYYRLARTISINPTPSADLPATNMKQLEQHPTFTTRITKLRASSEAIAQKIVARIGNLVPQSTLDDVQVHYDISSLHDVARPNFDQLRETIDFCLSVLGRVDALESSQMYDNMQDIFIVKC